MNRKLLLVSLISIGGWYTCYAQDPSVGGFVVNPSSIATGANGTVSADFGNGSSADIPQANNGTYIINLPPNIGVVSTSVQPNAPTSTTANLVTTVSPYDPVNGQIIRVISSAGPVPGNANYTITINVLGVQPTGGTPAPININASSTPALGSNVTGNDIATSSITVTGPLPVALVSFTARAQQNHTVDLAWTTSLETNNKSFLVERSKDLSGFEVVGEVSEVAPMSNALKNYHLVDQTPYSGTSYYRLTQTDLSGKATIYPVVSVVLRDESYGVYPNPVVRDGRFSLRLDEPETATLGFFGADGRALPLQKTGVQSGNLLLKTTANLSAGVYVLTVQERGQTRQHRIVVE
ncbi:T9SS type A sorting domain-containing protein [Spirosoma pollinicola]|uniref:Secretion system C-terminal sorting domain-containing protein n=1 Tax=Spirosoma pollinicola TaxID=2057025 RepID=A0A2K8YXY5_9BACT|nr:T9SS type A sorting domain-containing protein [Spirosoma pollinicola]AUD02482.1 hypothetical protein CWM47_11985 [Spirosoma pollinicola]